MRFVSHVKGTVHPQIRSVYFFSHVLCCSSISILWVGLAKHWIYLLERCLPSLKYNGSKWQSTVRSLDNPQTVFGAVSCMSYFLFFPNFTNQTHHCTEGSVHLLTFKKLMFVTHRMLTLMSPREAEI